MGRALQSVFFERIPRYACRTRRSKEEGELKKCLTGTKAQCTLFPNATSPNMFGGEMKGVILLAVIALVAYSLRAPLSDGRILFPGLHSQSESRSANRNMTSDPAQQLTAGTGTWQLGRAHAKTVFRDEVKTYTFKVNHTVVEVRTVGPPITEPWSIQTMGRDTQLQIGSQLYQLFFKTEGGATEMRLGRLANSKAEPSIFMDYKLIQHREP